MPAPTTIDEFLTLIFKSGLVDLARLDARLQQLHAAGALPQDPIQLADLLIRAELLTYFQAEQFLMGKWRGFTIGKYDVLERLGIGGTGFVYLCQHRYMRRRVAVKVLATDKAEDPRALELFYREAQAAAALDHPNIARAHDVDQDGALHFLVMEYVDGCGLDRLVRKRGPLEVARACHYIRQAALGLQHAHEAGLVHRDIKPANLLLDQQGVVKILDMGLARFFQEQTEVSSKKYSQLLGTVDYLSPEQAINSEHVDIRSDIYSLGATFYYILTGRPPFEEGSLAQKLICHQVRHPRSVRELQPEVPPELAAIIERMMAKDPQARFPFPAALVDALDPWAQTPVTPLSLPPSNRLSPLARRPAPVGPVVPPPTPASSSAILRRGVPAPTPLGAPLSARRDTPMDLVRPDQDTLQRDAAIRATPSAVDRAPIRNGQHPPPDQPAALESADAGKARPTPVSAADGP